MLASDLKALQETYQDIYEESDGISCEMLEEIVEELVEEFVEFGYTIDEAASAVEEAAILYIDEAKVTYGSDTESPEQRRERAKAKVGEKRAAARKTAVKSAVGRVKAKAAGAAAGASIAGSIAKDTARRAARTAVHKVTYGAQKKKQEVKSGVKSLVGRGLRKAAGAVGKVAQKAAGVASRLGEGKIHESGMVGTPGPSIPGAKPKPNKPQNSNRPNSSVSSPGSDTRRIGGYDLTRLSNSYEPKAKLVDEQNAGPSTPVKFDSHMGQLVPNQGAGRVGAVRLKPGMGLKKGGTVKAEEIEFDAYDVVLEYLMSDGHASSVEEAHHIMTQMDGETIQSIVENVMGGPVMKPGSGLGGAKPVYPSGTKKPAPTGAKLPPV